MYIYYLFVPQSIYHSTVYLSIHLSIYPSIYITYMYLYNTCVDAVDNLIPLQDNLIGDIFSTLEHTNPFHGIEPMALDDQSFCSTSSHHVSMETGNVVQSYEDLVRVYVQSTLAAAVSYAHETDLSKRVKKWEERIKPRLLKEVGVARLNSCKIHSSLTHINPSSNHLSIHPSFYPSTNIYMYQCIHLSIYLQISIYPSIYIYLSIHLSFYPSTHLFIRSSIH